MASFSVGALGEDSGYATLSGLQPWDADRQAYFTIRQNGIYVDDAFDVIPANSTKSITVYFDGLDSGTRYCVTYSVYEGDKWIAEDASGKCFTTDEAEEEFDCRADVASIEETRAVLYAHSFTCDESNYIQVLLDGDEVFNKRISSWINTYDGIYEFENLEPDTYYEVEVYLSTTRYDYENFVYYERFKTLKPARPSYFYWINSSTRLNDSSHKGKPISDYITASKWKALQNNVNEVRVYKGLGNYSFSTNIVSGVTPITAALYNEVANAINAMKSGTVSKVTKGVTPITTSVMMSLQDGINSIT